MTTDMTGLSVKKDLKIKKTKWYSFFIDMIEKNNCCITFNYSELKCLKLFIEK